MKILIVLLACFAAAKAASMYSYSYYYHNGFCVYPNTQTYYYRVSFNSYWCSTRYYANILKMYPGADCGKDGWKETPTSEIVSEMRNLLKESLHKMAQEMIAARDAWLKKVDESHKSFKATFVNYISRYYEYQLSCVTDAAEKTRLINEKNKKIADYNAKLDEARSEALKKYNAAILSKLNSIIEFHAKLLENAAKCLVTRGEKIDAFQGEINTKIKTYVINYYKYLLALLKKRSANYRAALVQVHCSAEWEKDIVDAAVAAFAKHEMIKIRDLVAAYTKQLLEAKDKLIGYYTCAYRCYLSNSYLQFARSYYYSGCQKLGNWYQYSRYTYTNYCMGSFSYRWRKSRYTGLKTCNLSTLNKSVAEVKTELKKILDDAYSKYVTAFGQWKLKWINYHIEYLKCYKQVVQERHAWIIGYTTKKYQNMNGSLQLTPDQQAELAKLKQELEKRYNDAVAAYEKQLIARINECAVQFSNSIKRYRENAESYFKRFIDSYASCMSNRASRIASYKKSLESNRDRQKESMVKHLSAGKLAHFQSYIKMITAYHGENLPEPATDLIAAYADKLVSYCSKIVGEFDSYWSESIAKLVLHYSCSYKCTYRTLYAPTYYFGSYYRWSASYPKADCYRYQYYTYYYRSQ